MRSLVQALLRPFERFVDPVRVEDVTRPPDRLFAFIWYFARQIKWLWAAFLIAGLGISIVEISLFAFVGQLIDLMREADPSTVWSDNGGRFLFMLFVVLVVRVVVQVIGSIIEHQMIVPGFFNLVRWQSHRYVARQSMNFFQNDFAGRIATKIMQAGQSTGDCLINLMQSLWFFVVFAVSTFALFLDLDWRLAFTVAAWLAGYGFLARSLIPDIRRTAKRTADMRSVFNGRIVDSYTNIQTVKLFGRPGHEDGFVRKGLEMMTESVADLTRVISEIRISLTILNGFFLASAGALCIVAWQDGEITPGQIAVALGLVLRLNTMSGWMMFQISGLFRDLGNIHDAMETIARENDIIDRSGANEIAPVAGNVRFDNVRFHYGKDSGVIEDLSLAVEAGQKIGLVGRSGAGKSTIVNLLLRFYDLESGHILIDGQDISSVTQDSLRSQIGMVTQDTSLLHRSVRDNILYGRPDATEEMMIDAAKRAEAHEFILDLSDPKGRTGYDAHVGERGVKLSGGQRQRIAIARVMLKDAPILILDEATSALDSEVEAAIQENLYRLMEGKTVIAIAHRLSTIAALDHLVVLDKGHIVEQGSHDALVAKDGLYASLWKRQSGGLLARDIAAE